MGTPPFIRRVTLRHYRSIARCRVDLGSFTLLVGPNGAGKSNFLDALRLVGDALSSTLEHALRQRGGVGEVRRRSSGHPNHFVVNLDLVLPSGATATYGFEIGAEPEGGFFVRWERAVVAPRDELGKVHEFQRKGTDIEVVQGIDLNARVASDALYLTAISGQPPYRELHQALGRMGFYSLHPSAMQQPQEPDSGEILRRDGANLPSVLRRMERDGSPDFQRIGEYLRRVVPGVEAVRHKAIGSWETVEFSQRMAGARAAWKFEAASMSDGSLRALGVLVALFQSGNGKRGTPTLVGIEEPESAIHPGATAVLVDAMHEASKNKQVLVTTHSPELLDHDHVREACLLSVAGDEGESLIAPIDAGSSRAIRERLFSAGDLLRAGQLEPDLASIPAGVSQADLFISES